MKGKQKVERGRVALELELVKGKRRRRSLHHEEAVVGQKREQEERDRGHADNRGET